MAQCRIYNKAIFRVVHPLFTNNILCIFPHLLVYCSIVTKKPLTDKKQETAKN